LANNPKSCDGFVQGDVSQTGATTTFVSYRLTLTGDLRDLTLYRSSGNAALDAAAIACAAVTRIPPMKIDGKPTEITWIGGVAWNSNWRTFHELAPDGTYHACLQWYPREAVRKGQRGAVAVKFHIAVDGGVRDVVITGSSGFPLLDNATVECVSTWKYFPATQNGIRVQLDSVSTLTWMTR
jgi:TonB family protein